MIYSGTSRAIVTGAVLIILAGTSLAATPETPASKTTVRSGNHPGFGRVVIDTNGQTAYHWIRTAIMWRYTSSAT